MAPNLTSGEFKIVSLTEGNPPLGIHFTLPGLQFVRLNGPVTNWTVEEEGDTYRFSLGNYPFTGVVDKKVAASIHAGESTEWIATYREAQDAYTISPIDDDIRGWTVANAEDPNAWIVLKPIRSTRSLPPQFSTSQLFRFEEIDE